MTEDEVYAMLAKAFGPGTRLKEFRDLGPLEGLRESVKYWHWAEDIQEKATSDRKWWEYENEKTLAYVLMGVFCWRLLGHDDFPALPDASPDVLMDEHAHLCLWSRSLPLDHVHKWVTCHHDRKTNRASHPRCKITGGKGSVGLSHQICDVCGEERFDPQPMVDRAQRMLKERGVVL